MQGRLLVCLLSLWVARAYTVDPVQVLYEWKQVDFDFPTPRIRQTYIDNGSFNPLKTFPLDVDYSPFDGRVFITCPRFYKGVPATLNTVEYDNYGSYVLRPYPSWEANDPSNCNNIISVLRVKVTECGHLWVLDSGVDDVMNTYQRICQPKIVVIDLKTNRLMFKYEIPEKDLEKNSLLGTVEVVGNCSHGFAYLADIVGHGIVVVDASGRSPRSWRVANRYMQAEEGYTQFNINGEKFQLEDGTISLVASHGYLYFHSLAGAHEYTVPLAVLNNPQNFLRPDNSITHFQQSQGQRTGQSGPATMVKTGNVMVFSNLPQNALYCWKYGTPYTEQYLYPLYQNNTTLQFLGGMKRIRNPFSGVETWWCLSSRFQNVINNRVNPNEVNYRVNMANVDLLLARTPCGNMRGPHTN